MSLYEDDNLLEMIEIIFQITRVSVTSGFWLKKANGKHH